MKLVSIKPELLALYEQDAEVLRKAGRPYVAVVKLRYRGCVCDFAVPIRSNIPAAAPKEQYFALPPRPTTRPFNRHGLHYIKMFPVDRRYFERYRTEGNALCLCRVPKSPTRPGQGIEWLSLPPSERRWIHPKNLRM